MIQVEDIPLTISVSRCSNFRHGWGCGECPIYPLANQIHEWKEDFLDDDWSRCAVVLVWMRWANEGEAQRMINEGELNNGQI
jgi:hypothetical protein